MTLTEFLLARIAEDEAKARDDYLWGMTGEKWKRYPEAAYNEIQSLTLEKGRRLLAECEAKRRIIAEHPIGGSLRGPVTDNKFYVCEACGPFDWPWDPETRDWVVEPPSGDFWPCVTLRAIAAVYADHPNYDPEWSLARDTI